MTHTYSPLRYPGGKSCVFPFISDILKNNGMYDFCYAEPYAGGAGLALRLLFEEHVQKIYINDLDPLIFSFWKSAIESTDNFCSWIQETPVTPTVWKRCRDIARHPRDYDTFTLGTATFFLNRTNVSGVIKGGLIGGMEQYGKYKMDARYNPQKLIEKIQKVGRFRDRIILSNLDGIKCIQTLNRKKEKVFVYLDPPYVEKGSDLYMNFYNNADHTNLANNLPLLKKPWIVSYDNNQFIMDLYGSYRKITHRLSHSTSKRSGREVFILSADIKHCQAVNSLRDAVLIEGGLFPPPLPR